MKICVSVSLFSSLRVDRFDKSQVELPAGSTVTDLMVRLHIPLQDVGIVVVNNRSGTFQQKLQENDKLTLIPPIGGG